MKKKKWLSYNIKKCPNCHKEIRKMLKLCPKCNFRIIPSIGEEKLRNLRITELIKSGKYTLQQVGDLFHLTRERVRQIYCRTTQEKHVLQRRTLFSLRKQIEYGEKMEEIKFYCNLCKKPVKRQEKSVRMFCHECRNLILKKEWDIHIKMACISCGKEFFALRTSKMPLYCSRQCYQKIKVNKTADEYKKMTAGIKNLNIAWLDLKN